ncbi:MAG TPA: protein kinase [Gemmatimonadaceae bacterium]|nr:protein kinase [Gemmatimonadaceae bacterium]
MLRLRTLGGLSLWRGGDQVAAAGAPGWALHFLAILALAGDRTVGADDILALLWPGQSRDDARRELGVALTALPQWLAGAHPVRSEGDDYQLDAAVISSDVHDFEFAAGSGAPEDAARLYEGEFLHGVTSPGKSFDHWREREGARLAQLAKWCRDASRPRRSKVMLTPGAQVGHGGRYRIERELGAGGAATVYLAHDSRHDRPVALKVLRAEISETISPERFEKEIRFVAQLQHPHILPLFDSGEIGNVLYSVMPYVQGESVRERLDRTGKLPVDDAVRIAAEIADALAYAHEHGVLHRDVKPENILLSDGHALIADFGIARSVDAHHEGRTTLPGVVLGTAAYMSPEQATGEAELDGRTDVYAVGAVLYEMLTGAPPFAGETARRTMTRRLTEVPPRVSKQGVRVPGAVDDILARALQPLPENRMMSREFASALSSVQRRLTKQSPAGTPTRRRVPIISVAVVVLTALALLFAFRCARAQGAPRSTPDKSLLQRVLAAEDSRGKDAGGVDLLLEAATGSDSVLQRAAIRALGRLHNLKFAMSMLPTLDAPSPAIRAEGANAVAQSVQGLPRVPDVQDSSRSRRTVLITVQSALIEHLRSESNPAVMGVLARSLGRLPFQDSTAARAAERAIVGVFTMTGAPAEAFARLAAGGAHDVAEGLYSLARGRRTTGTPSPEALDVLRAAARYRADARVRRIGLLGLAAAGALDSSTVLGASRDADAQVRRLALAGVGTLAAAVRADVVKRALADTSAMVRIDGIGAIRATRAPSIRAERGASNAPDCAAIVAATHDRNPHVVLAAIDGLALPCANAAVRNQALKAIAGTLDAGASSRPIGHATWRAPAHAIVALARVDSASAGAALPRFSAHGNAHVREYAARAAAELRDGSTLLRLAADADHNVQDAAIVGLSRVRTHDADSVYIAALASGGYQVVLAGAAALAGSTRTEAVPALFDALDRLSAERRENSRDPRMALIARIGELGTPSNAPRLERYLGDFDTTVAGRAADLLTKWTGRTVAPHAMPLPIRAEPLAGIFMSSGLQLQITMDKASGGGTIVVRLFADEAPATVARIVRLAREHYYDGLTFHRVVANFVIQGGSPDANEYMGDGPFMRDELGLRSHDRGTLGISTRGRDTGDGQLFVNLVDNPRLDHDYTVFGEIVSGLPVMDGILEGDVIARVEVRGLR